MKRTGEVGDFNFDLSICIVSYKTREYLQNCLRSVYENSSGVRFEIIVVDNNSQDSTIEMLNKFHDVRVIRNERNYGYTQPMNQAMRASLGKHVLQLNPDTLIQPNTLDLLYDFLKNHPDVGIVGPKVLNVDGTLQKPCRRSEARPWDVFSYFLGLADRFPADKRFSGYYMGYMDENATHEVHGVSGSCMLIRRETIQQIGYLDERFFAYQEDADYCFRAREAGWKVYYYPEAHIIHYGGKGGSLVQPYRSIWEWHKSYWLYYRKNLSSDYFFIFNWLYYSAMFLKLFLTVGQQKLRKRETKGSRRS